MTFQRDIHVVIDVDCPEELVVNVDRVRLKQVVLNLVNNANKFVSKGFVRMVAKVTDSCLMIAVEDSGAGIPESTNQQLFVKFQESLDVLQQGTVSCSSISMFYVLKQPGRFLTSWSITFVPGVDCHGTGHGAVLSSRTC